MSLSYFSLAVPMFMFGKTLVHEFHFFVAMLNGTCLAVSTYHEMVFADTKDLLAKN